MRKGNYLFSSESVTEGHPDKICDQISDAILDACLEQDPDSRVAVECMTKTGALIVAGELTTRGYVNIPNIVRQVLKEIGYTKQSFGIDSETCAVFVHLEEQSPDIALGVNKGKGRHREQGAGDQGMMFGYATNETENLMPLPIDLAHKLTRRLAQVRKENIISGLGPDGKSQVTIRYVDDRPRQATTVVVSNQHEDIYTHDDLQKLIIEHVIKPVCGDWLDDDTQFLVNPTGKFIKGGPLADAGLTGRKIIVDTYGGIGRHGGGAFSGKDPSKVDRSAAYAARYIAKNVVAAGLADRCEIQLAYAIGVAPPVSINIDLFETGRVPEEKLLAVIQEHFPLKPEDIINHLRLKRPIYKQTAAYGHFGRSQFPWEKTDKVDILRKLLN